MIKAVFFDLDGVIADTLHYHYLAWEKLFQELGGSVSEHSVLLHEGRASREILPTFLAEAGVSLPPEEHADFIERKRAYYRSIVKVTYYPHVFEVIAELRARGFHTALVTASSKKNMETALGAEHRALFDFLITGDEVHRAKPHPDPYLAPMHHLGLSPAECVVVENAPLGLESARNAGMTCVAVETTLDRTYLGLADHIIHEIRELLALPLLRNAS
ncbi:MAG: HAD family phosphatase [Bacteroidota bacterium]|jgi:beta-phosphoglucomutase|nr:HAD family phosphatase [Bacteroidota bacterium]